MLPHSFPPTTLPSPFFACTTSCDLRPFVHAILSLECSSFPPPLPPLFWLSLLQIWPRKSPPQSGFCCSPSDDSTLKYSFIDWICSILLLNNRMLLNISFVINLIILLWWLTTVITKWPFVWWTSSLVEFKFHESRHCLVQLLLLTQRLVHSRLSRNICQVGEGNTEA